MTENKKIYIIANELAVMLGVCVEHAYKLIRKLNQEIEKEEFRHRNEGYLKSGFVVPYFQTVGTQCLDYSVVKSVVK